MTLVLNARRAHLADGIAEHVAVTVEDGLIVGVGPAVDDPVHETLAPGFVDLQVNGHADVDVGSMTERQWPRIRHLLLAQGVTTWCPTLITGERSFYDQRLGHLRRFADDPGPGPEVAGVHLEGPYLGERHGAHRMVPPGPIDLDWLAALPDLVTLVTLGPERENAVEATRLLVERDVVVALGHTTAAYDRVLECVEAGATLFTHCFNAATPLDHREPGAVGAALATDGLAISLIADNVHVHPAVLRIAMRAKPSDKTILVTDAVGWQAPRATARTGTGDRRIELRDGAPRLPDDTLAGSALTMDRAIRNVAAAVGTGGESGGGAGGESAVRAATANPARLLGLDDRGVLAVGRRADLVTLDEDGRVVGTWVAGRRLHPGAA